VVRATGRDFVPRYGPWALVAGASEGIGAAFAHAIASRGLPVALVSRRRQPLESLAASITRAHGVETLVISGDLATPGVVGEIADALGQREIGLLVANAAYSPIGRFVDSPLDEQERALAVNVIAPLALAHRFGAAMARRGRGGIVLMSSLTAFQGTAMIATYAATKAFNLVLAEGLWDELRDHGVDVLGCIAGATATPGYLTTTPLRPSRFSPPAMDPRAVAEEALVRLGTTPSMVMGRANRAVSLFMARLLSRKRAVTMIGRATRRLYEHPLVEKGR